MNYIYLLFILIIIILLNNYLQSTLVSPFGLFVIYDGDNNFRKVPSDIIFKVTPHSDPSLQLVTVTYNEFAQNYLHIEISGASSDTPFLKYNNQYFTSDDSSKLRYIKAGDSATSDFINDRVTISEDEEKKLTLSLQ